MRRIKAIAISVIVLGAIVGVLLNNKARMQAKSKTNLLTSYPVSVATVNAMQLSETLSLTGTIAANRDVAIVAETQGRVVGVYANVGDFKSAGATLVRVDDELRRAELIKAEVNYERAKKDADRFSKLRDEHAATEWQKENAWQSYKIAEAEYIRARKAYRDTKISSPIAGVITSRPVDVGTMVQPGMVVANVVDISKLKVKLNVAEQDVFKLKVGDPLEVTTDVYPGVKFRGRIASLSSKADESHTYPVEITLPNSTEHPLKAGMFGRVNFVSMKSSEVVTIPREALVGSIKSPQVFVVEHSVAKLRNLVIGSRVGTNVAVLQGVKEGETIVVNGQTNLKDGVVVEVMK
jgi:RND family efflux transporter MFP subunit